MTRSNPGGRFFVNIFLQSTILQNLHFIGNLYTFIAGMALAWTSPVLPKLLDEASVLNIPLGRTISTEEASWIGSLLPLGGIVGTFAAGFASTKIGRKRSVLICCAVPFLASFITLATAQRIVWYYIARLVAGFAVSSAYTVIPMYNGEISEISIRGRICSSITTFETAGELFSYCVGPYLTISWFCTACLIVAIASTAVFCLIFPESPYYLVSINDKNGAERSLMKLRSKAQDDIKSEFDLIHRVVEDSRINHGTIYDILKSRALRKAQRITTGLVILQHLSGIIPILFYTQTIFYEAGSRMPPEICSMIIGGVQFSSSLVTPNLVDRLGRRWMLLISASGMLIAQFHMGLYFFLKNHGRDVSEISWLPLACLIFYIVSYIMGFGPLPWTVMGEIFPPQMKSAASAVTVCVCWSFAFILSKYFHSISGAIGIAGSFWIFAGSCFVAIVFILGCVFETKGKNLEEIQRILNS